MKGWRNHAGIKLADGWGRPKVPAIPHPAVGSADLDCPQRFFYSMAFFHDFSHRA